MSVRRLVFWEQRSRGIPNESRKVPTGSTANNKPDVKKFREILTQVQIKSRKKNLYIKTGMTAYDDVHSANFSELGKRKQRYNNIL